MNEFPPPDPAWAAYQRQMDDGNLRTLAILHRVYAALLLVLMMCFAGYAVLFIGLIGSSLEKSRGSGPPREIFGLFGFIWGAVFLFLLGKAILNFLAAKWIERRQNWTGIVVVNALNCLNMPLGTGLGVFGFITLTKPHVKSTFTS